MKKYVSYGLIAVSVVVLISIDLFITSSADFAELEKLKIKEVNSTTYAFKTLDDDVIEIGIEKHSPARPYLKLNKSLL